VALGPTRDVVIIEGPVETIPIGGAGRSSDIGHGTLAMARDPQGAFFTLFAGEIDP